MHKPEPTLLEMPGTVSRASARQLTIAYAAYAKQDGSSPRALAALARTLQDWQDETGIQLVDDVELEAAKNLLTVRP